MLMPVDQEATIAETQAATTVTSMEEEGQCMGEEEEAVVVVAVDRTGM